MKKISFVNAALVLGAAVVLTLSSCSAETEEVLNVEEQNTIWRVPVRVRVKEFSVSMEAIPESQTRATQSPADYTDIKIMILAFYDSEGTEVYKTTQTKGSLSTGETFGDFRCNLPAGTFTMVVIGRDSGTGDAFTLTSPTEAAFTSEKVRETFAKTQSVTVTNSNALDLEVTLGRIVPELYIESTDTRPEGISKIRTTYGGGGKSFNPTTGLSIGNAGFSLTNTPSSANVGDVVKVMNYAYLATDEQTMEITLEVLDAEENVLVTKVIPNVPLKRNRRTTLSGPLFTPSASSVSFVLETDWLDGNTVEF